VSRYQKGKTNLDSTEARDSEWQWHQMGHMQACTLLQKDNTPAPHHSVALPAAQPTASKHCVAYVMPEVQKAVINGDFVCIV